MQYFGPADIIGHDFGVQYSISTPYSKLISLKNSIVFTASHSFRSSPEGSSTALYMFPLPIVICASFRNSYPRDPFSILRSGLF